MTPLSHADRIALAQSGVLKRTGLPRQILGHHFGKLGGPARARALSPERRLEIARVASAAAKAKRDAAR